MSEKNGKELFLRPEISRELDKIRQGKEQTDRIGRENWPREETLFSYSLRAKEREAWSKILKGHDYDKQRKVDKKIGGVRGKFHPSLERTRKRT